MKQLLSIIVVVVVLGGFAWLVQYVGRSHQPTVIDTGRHILVGSTTPDGNYEYTEEGSYYTIDTKYPAATLLSGPADEKARLVIETKLKNLQDEYRQNVKDLTPEILPSLSGGDKLQFIAEYKTYASTSTVSYLFTVFENTGGAHPNTTFETFVFDEQGNQLKLGDLFKTDADYLKPIAAAATTQVTKQLQEGMEVRDVSNVLFKEGLLPKDENFSDWVLDGDALFITIPQYQAAPYAAGSFEVRIQLSDLRDILK